MFLFNEAFDPNEPLISAAICAELLTTEPSASPSSLVILEAKLELTDVNEPLIFVPKAELNTVASKCANEPVDVEEPLILPDTSKLPVIVPSPVCVPSHSAVTPVIPDPPPTNCVAVT